MANDEHVALLKQGVEAWNAWREENPNILPDLSNADLSKASLIGANLREWSPSPAGYRLMARRDPVHRSAWPRRIEKPVLVLLDHRTKRVAPLRLARSVNVVVFAVYARRHGVLVE
jgi:hypothetical protein